MIRRNIGSPYCQYLPHSSNEAHLGEYTKTSDKVKRIIECFPPNTSPVDSNYDARLPVYGPKTHEDLIYYNFNPHLYKGPKSVIENEEKPATDKETDEKKPIHPWRWAREAMRLLQLALMATTLVVYYIIYCYMQLIYYTLRSALYFHNADRAMKVTIGLLVITSIIFGFNVLVKLQQLIRMILF